MVIARNIIVNINLGFVDALLHNLGVICSSADTISHLYLIVHKRFWSCVVQLQGVICSSADTRLCKRSSIRSVDMLAVLCIPTYSVVAAKFWFGSSQGLPNYLE